MLLWRKKETGRLPEGIRRHFSLSPWRARARVQVTFCYFVCLFLLQGETWLGHVTPEHPPSEVDMRTSSGGFGREEGGQGGLWGQAG